jgi:dTDP-4-dehydrorhamnose 3,5-epimerase
VKFHPTDIPGAYLIEAEPDVDERGMFSRFYCPDEFATAGLDFRPLQTSLSRSVLRHTLRGIHYQEAPRADAKLVHVTRGAIYEVIVDLRQESPAFGHWAAFDLDARSLRAVYVPKWCAHGFLTLEPDTDLLYQIDQMYVPGFARGYRWDDPLLNIRWPAGPAMISDADRNWPNFPRHGPP